MHSPFIQISVKQFAASSALPSKISTVPTLVKCTSTEVSDMFMAVIV